MVKKLNGSGLIYCLHFCFDSVNDAKHLKMHFAELEQYINCRYYNLGNATDRHIIPGIYSRY